MSYEKLKVIGIDSITSKKSGEVFNVLKVELMVTRSIFLNGEALKQIPTYEKLIGKEAIFPCEEGVYNGKPSMSLTGDFKPLSI
jgi:hypothetical protein